MTLGKCIPERWDVARLCTKQTGRGPRKDRMAPSSTRSPSCPSCLPALQPCGNRWRCSFRPGLRPRGCRQTRDLQVHRGDTTMREEPRRTAAHRRPDLSDRVGQRLEPHLPGGPGQVGCPAADHRRFFECRVWDFAHWGRRGGTCPPTTATGRIPIAASAVGVIGACGRQ